MEGAGLADVESMTALLQSGIVGLAKGEGTRLFAANDRYRQMLGVSRDMLDPDGVDMLDMTPPERREAAADIFAKVATGAPVDMAETEFMSTDGRRIPALVGYVPAVDAPGGWLSVAVELSGELMETVLGAEHLRRAAESEQLAALQYALLPSELSPVDGVDIAVEYRAATGLHVGGDWYDAVQIDGLVLLTVGDVAGHGLSVIQAMAELRSAARTGGLLDADCRRIAMVLDRYVRILVNADIVTAVVASYDLDTRELEWTLAGHPPPLLIASDGSVSYLPGAVNPPLGVAQQTERFRAQRVTLAPGDTVLLFTDGLVERSGESIDVGMERLRGAARLGLSPAQQCVQAISTCLPAGNPKDDTCVLALQVS